jgi:Fur family zinc uptake transcriptional regulator
MAEVSAFAPRIRPADVMRALDRVEERCQERGVRLTRLRRAVLELVLGADQPLGAYELLDRLSAGVGAKSPPTIYRALNFLLEQRYIHRIESLNAFAACVDIDHPHDSQFLICGNCGRAEELHDPEFARSLKRHSEKLGFRLQEQIVELRGLCADCQAPERMAAAAPAGTEKHRPG